MQRNANSAKEKKTQMRDNVEQDSKILNIISIYCTNPDNSFSLVRFCLCSWPETLVKTDRTQVEIIGSMSSKTKQNKTKNKGMLAIQLSENCMPLPSYMKLHNLFSIVSVRSRNIFCASTPHIWIFITFLVSLVLHLELSTTDSADLVLGGIKFREYPTRSNPNKPKGTTPGGRGMGREGGRGGGGVWN